MKRWVFMLFTLSISASTFAKNDTYDVGMRIKKMMHDPDSVKFDKVYMIEGQNAYCVSFSAKNGFNAIRKGAAIAAGEVVMLDTQKGFGTAWNKYCYSKGRALDLTFLFPR